MTIPIGVELDITHFRHSDRLTITFAMNGSEIHEVSQIQGNQTIQIDDVKLLPNSRNTFTMQLSGFRPDTDTDTDYLRMLCKIKNLEFDEIPLASLIGSHGKFTPGNSPYTTTALPDTENWMGTTTALTDKTIKDNGCWILEFNDPLYHWMFEQT